MQVHCFQAGHCNARNEGDESVNRAEGVSAISVIPQSDLRLLQQAVQQEALPQTPACFIRYQNAKDKLCFLCSNQNAAHLQVR